MVPDFVTGYLKFQETLHLLSRNMWLIFPPCSSLISSTPSPPSPSPPLVSLGDCLACYLWAAVLFVQRFSMSKKKKKKKRERPVNFMICHTSAFLRRAVGDRVWTFPYHSVHSCPPLPESHHISGKREWIGFLVPLRIGQLTVEEIISILWLWI